MSIDPTPDAPPSLDLGRAVQTLRGIYQRVVAGPPAVRLPLALAPGACIDGRYEVIREVGRGGMGVLLGCRHVHTGQEVMVKTLRPEYAASAEHRERLRREGRALAQAECEHLVPIRDMGDDPATGAPYLVLPLLDGEDLGSLLGRRSRLGLAEAMLVLVPVMQALMRLHRVGFVHRDVNPNNIFLARRPSGEVRPTLLDLGIARELEGARPEGEAAALGPGARRTAAGMLLGTAPYMAPEQVRNVGAVDARADVWAVAVTLYEVLAGANPFGGGDEPLEAVFEAIVRRDPPRLDAAAPGVPAAFALAVRRAMSRDPAARFASMQHFIEALNEGAGRASPLRFATSPPLAHLARRAERPVRAAPAPVERLPSELLEPTEPRTAAPATARRRVDRAALRDVLLAAVIALNLVTLAALVTEARGAAGATSAPRRVAGE